MNEVTLPSFGGGGAYTVYSVNKDKNLYGLEKLSKSLKHYRQQGNTIWRSWVCDYLLAMSTI